MVFCQSKHHDQLIEKNTIKNLQHFILICIL